MPNEPQWLTPELIAEFSALAVAETGEPHALIELEVLDSALAKPVNHWR